MEELAFDLPVMHKGDAYMFPAILKPRGYSYTIEVDINGIPVQFEPDEENSFRAFIVEDHLQKPELAGELLHATGDAISKVLK